VNFVRKEKIPDATCEMQKEKEKKEEKERNEVQDFKSKTSIRLFKCLSFNLYSTYAYTLASD
jgi:hypothetical protein